ncbi:hypothetical protein HW49_07145 [Porphyromonadaceae bacterium COT-184 OH4590]|nr:hypothetical protein HW49_07145 [Porphyromonadaceae bacterium COT-184 OH4590]
MKKLFLLSIVFISTFTFVSCEKEAKDTEKPVINLIAPKEDEALKPGSDVHFDVAFSDNEALKSYSVNIHGAFDGHTHKVISNAAGDSIAFEHTWVEDDFIKMGAKESINGKKNATIHHHYIEIPATINGKPIKEGHYHFMVYCTDHVGNQSMVAREIEISYSAKGHDHHH